MKHRASPRFWASYGDLPPTIRELADKSYELVKANPRHPSLHLKRIGDHYRALGIDDPDGIYWIWIGTHADYDKLISR